MINHKIKPSTIKSVLGLMCSISLIVLIGCSKSETTSPPNLEGSTTVMSFNIRYDNPNDGINVWTNRKEACIEMLNELKPSIFGIQEGLNHQVNYLDTQLPQYSYVGVGREDGKNKGEYAALFYLKDVYTSLNQGTFWLSETPEVPSIGWDAALERIVTWVQLKNRVSHKTLYVFNTHFDHEGEQAREESAKLLIAKINQLTTENETVIITGDFNGLIQQSLFNPIKAQFQNAQQNALVSDHTNSFNAFGDWGGLLSLNIDFIFYKNSTAIKYRTIDKDYGIPYISDHYPIVATFTD